MNLVILAQLSSLASYEHELKALLSLLFSIHIRFYSTPVSSLPQQHIDIQNLQPDIIVIESEYYTQ